ncbi:hypothetical protein HanPSC8_Chr09g0376891 [Helianthus annuus]|nr:hypothetical protein HanPSC8_Chr09g0376891 [Helianthus annuus]
MEVHGGSDGVGLFRARENTKIERERGRERQWSWSVNDNSSATPYSQIRNGGFLT